MTAAVESDPGANARVAAATDMGVIDQFSGIWGDFAAQLEQVPSPQ
jgi:hypothetical protein